MRLYSKGCRCYKSNIINSSNRDRNQLFGHFCPSRWTAAAIRTRIDNGRMVPIELRAEYLEYYDAVVRFTEKQDQTSLEHIEKRGVLGKDDNAQHLDHIVSIYDGFMNDVPVEIIGHIVNLQCIPGTDNIKKGNRSDMTIAQLYERYNNYVGI